MSANVKLDGNNLPNIFVRTKAGNPQSYGSLYTRKDLDNSWEIIYPGSASSNHGLAGSMELDSNNRAHLLYVSDSNSWNEARDNRLKYSKMGA